MRNLTFVKVLFWVATVLGCFGVNQKHTEGCIVLEGNNILFSGAPNIVRIKNYHGSSENLIIRLAGKDYYPIHEFTYEINALIAGRFEAELFDLKSNKVLLIQPFYFKELPLPSASLPSIRDGEKTIGKNQLLAQLGLECQIKNWDYNITYPIETFSILNFEGKAILSNGSKFSVEQKKYLEGLKSGDYLIIFEIFARMPYGRKTKELAPVIYQIK
jgi:hypothetical protein